MSSIAKIEKVITDEVGYKKDFVGLSTESKPTTEVAGGSTFYCVDTGDLYIYYNGTWYLQEFVEPNESNSDNKNISLTKNVIESEETNDEELSNNEK